MTSQSRCAAIIQYLSAVMSQYSIDSQLAPHNETSYMMAY